jgi:hypothetical protein
MSLCIGIRENQLSEVVGIVDTKKYKFKCLYNSENYEEYYNELKIDVLRDALVFSGCGNSLAATRTKVKGNDLDTSRNILMVNIFEDERQVPIVNDFYDHEYIVLVFTNKYKNPAEKKGNTVPTTFTDDELDELIARFLKELTDKEGIPTATWQDYKFRRKNDDTYNMNIFINKQQIIDEEKKDSYKRQILKHFEESFKFRLITIYTKLRDYGLEDIMRKLKEFGYLDERFDDEVFIYEEEARRILARRLCTLSFKNDIDVLIKKEIISEDLIKYKI